jgi:hypothetical protein
MVIRQILLNPGIKKLSPRETRGDSAAGIKIDFQISASHTGPND